MRKVTYSKGTETVSAWIYPYMAHTNSGSVNHWAIRIHGESHFDFQDKEAAIEFGKTIAF